MKRIFCCLFLMHILSSALFAASAAPEALVTLELRDTELKDVLRAMGKQYGMNILFPESVSGRVTASMKDVPLYDALDSILKSGGYTYIREKNLVIVRQEPEALRGEDIFLVKEFRLKYLLAERAAESVKEILSAKGKAAPVESSNSIIVKDVPSIVEKVSALIERLDTRPAQIMIEGRFVEVDSNFKRQLGIEWKGGQEDTRLFNRPGKVEGSASVNLPTGEAEGGTFGLGLVVDRANLDLQLSALEDTGSAKVLSSPSILVLENEEASISSGEELVVPVSETATVIARDGNKSDKPLIFDAKIELTVRPRVIDGETITMTVATKREEFNYDRDVKGFPPKITKTARTELIVKDGVTVVIGGVLKERESVSVRGVPVLSKIPLIGRLFKKETKTKEKVELLIFLTPTILREVVSQVGEAQSGAKN